MGILKGMESWGVSEFSANAASVMLESIVHNTKDKTEEACSL